jgi:hypothetical protein
MGRNGAFGRSIVAAFGLLALAAVAVPTDLGAAPVAARRSGVGPELPVAYPVPATPQRGAVPAIAYGGSVHLMAWHAGSHVRAARVDRSGTVLDVPGFAISDGGWASGPAVASDGVNFLVAWLGPNNTMLTKRVSPAGEVLDATGVEVSASYPVPRNPAIAFDGTNYLVIWSAIDDQSETHGEVYGTRVSPAGVDLDPADIRITNSIGYKDRASVAFAGSHYLVVWDDDPMPDSNVFGTLVTTSGLPLDPTGVPISTAPGYQSRPVVTGVDDSYFVAWSDSRTDLDVYGTRVDASGTVLDPSGVPIATTGAYQPNIASDGTDVLVTYLQWNGSSSEPRAVRVDPAGTVLDPAGFALPIPTPAVAAALAFDGDHYFVASSASGPVRGTRVTPGGAVLDPDGITVSLGTNAQTGPQVAFDGTDDVVVWRDDRSEGAGPGLYGARVGPDGQVRDGTGFPIATGFTELESPWIYSVASDGTNVLVAWADVDDHGIRAALVNASGVVVDRFDISVDQDDAMNAPKVVFGGGVFLVVWGLQTNRDGEWANEIRGARVSTTGEVLDPAGLPLVTNIPWPRAEQLDVAFGKTDFLLVWQTDVVDPGDGRMRTDVLGTRVTTAGTVPSPAGFPISTADGWQLDPRIAWNGTEYLVVWTDTADRSAYPPLSDIRGARVDGAGVVLDPAGIAISTASGGQERPDVAANGPFLVTWTDRRRGTESLDLFATRVDPDGSVAHPEGLEIARSFTDYYGRAVPVTATRGAANFTVAYQRFLAGPPHATTRAFVRRISPK